MKFVIDRFEGDFAVVELPCGTMTNCPKAILPDNAKEGNIITIAVDETATFEKLQKNTKRMNDLFMD